MELQWLVMASAVAAEAAVALLLTVVGKRLATLVSLLLPPAAGILPFAAFQLLELCGKKELRLMCSDQICTAAERHRYERAMYKAQRNLILCISACLLYWCIYCIGKYHKAIREMEEVEQHKNL